MAKKKIKIESLNVQQSSTEELLKKQDEIYESFNAEQKKVLNIFSEVIRELTLRESI